MSGTTENVLARISHQEINLCARRLGKGTGNSTEVRLISHFQDNTAHELISQRKKPCNLFWAQNVRTTCGLLTWYMNFYQIFVKISGLALFDYKS
jgi:hypothetical protein